MRTTLLLVLTLLHAFAGCSEGEPTARDEEPATSGETSAEVATEAGEGGDRAEAVITEPEAQLYEEAREALAAELAQDGIDDPEVLEAIRTVPRHEFMPMEMRPFAYVDRPLPIGHEQTISQPYIVALMTQMADIEPGDRVLEVGTGSGYQAAVLAEVGAEVWSIEILEPLGLEARTRLDRLGYGDEVYTRIGDGYRGWPDEAPFDAVVITAAPPEIPDPLLEQLAVGGKMVVPVGERDQELMVITRTEEGYEREQTIPVRFVPMTGEAQEESAATPSASDAREG